MYSLTLTLVYHPIKMQGPVTATQAIAPTIVGGVTGTNGHPRVRAAASSVTFTVNGKQCTVSDGDKIVGPQTMLTEYLRDVLKLTGG